MAFNVRIFGYTGLTQIQQSMVKQYTAATVFCAEEPCLWSAKATSNGATPVSLTANLPPGVLDRALLLGIEIADNNQIRYELQPLGPGASNARVAGDLSRRMAGFDFIQWQPGAVFSFVDALSFP